MVDQLFFPATTWAWTPTAGETAETWANFAIARPSAGVSVEAAPVPLVAPFTVTFPGMTMSRLLPRPVICVAIDSRAPAPIDLDLGCLYEFTDGRKGVELATSYHPDVIILEFTTRFYDTLKFFDAFAGGKFAQFLFAAHQSAGKVSDADSARFLIDEAQLFVDASHACYNRMGTVSVA